MTIHGQLSSSSRTCSWSDTLHAPSGMKTRANTHNGFLSPAHCQWRTARQTNEMCIHTPSTVKQERIQTCVHAPTLYNNDIDRFLTVQRGAAIALDSVQVPHCDMLMTLLSLQTRFKVSSSSWKLFDHTPRTAAKLASKDNSHRHTDTHLPHSTLHAQQPTYQWLRNTATTTHKDPHIGYTQTHKHTHIHTTHNTHIHVDIHTHRRTYTTRHTYALVFCTNLTETCVSNATFHVIWCLQV